MGRQGGTRNPPVVSFVLLLTFLYIDNIYVRFGSSVFRQVVVVVVVVSSLENHSGFRNTNVRVKTDHSISLRWNKTF